MIAIGKHLHNETEKCIGFCFKLFEFDLPANTKKIIFSANTGIDMKRSIEELLVKSKIHGLMARKISFTKNLWDVVLPFSKCLSSTYRKKPLFSHFPIFLLPLAFNNVAIKLFNCYSENVDIFNQI
jgi:hypothetical protein